MVAVHSNAISAPLCFPKKYIWKLSTIRSLYIFYPIFNAVNNQEWLILQTIYLLKKEMWAQNLRLIIKSSFKSRAGYNGVCTVNY